MRTPKGFTLIEIISTLAIVGILVSITAWQMNVQIPRYRTNSVAGRMVLDVRKASAIASRTNRPVTLTVNPDGCSPGYTVEQGTTPYERVCFADDYRGVVFHPDRSSKVECEAEAELNFDPIPGCSMCTGTHSIRFLPTGEVRTPSGGDESLILGPRDDIASADRAVGIRNVTGRVRAYRPKGAGWDCP